jgi:D-sedoheptulose 7-phosphate isomerase
MQDTIRRFRNNYARRFAAGMSKFIGLHGQNIIRELHAALAKPRSTVYIFGNGGSHAISKCLEYALQSYAAHQALTLRIETGIDVHKMDWLQAVDSAGIPFVSTLEIEGADSRDMVVLVSGSGDSDNLCEVAHYTKRLSIPTIALIGSGKGKLRNLIPPSRCFCVSIEDQQISEDVLQSLAYFLDKPDMSVGSAALRSNPQEHAQLLQDIIREIPSSFIANIADTIFLALHRRAPIWILGLDHPVVSISAEHTAHNLYWDSIYEVDNPPQRLIFSSPTACDFSGISNDRRASVIANLVGLKESDGQGAVLLYSMFSDNHPLDNLLAQLDELAMPVFLLSGTGDVKLKYRWLTVHRTGIREPQIQASLAQILGHILGRIVRMKLIERRDGQVNRPTSDAARFLIDFDLAQRRLIDV